MRVPQSGKDDSVLDLFRTAGKCEKCKQPFLRREPHHIIACGLGGGHRMDIPINLVALGPTLFFPLCPCHGKATRNEDGHKRHDFLLIVVKREKLDMNEYELEEWLQRIERAPKGSDWRTL